MRTEYSAGVISLGCSKNTVDSERILSCLSDAGFTITNREDEADVIVINTCGFINPAKEESINTILDAAARKKPGALIAVAGCLSQRYPDDLKREMPEIDILHGVGNHEGFVDEICARLGIVKARPYCGGRILTTPPYSAYLRIADGCDNRCTYCAIPLIRGGKRSEPIESLVDEAKQLADNGVTELTLIAQDTSAYGTDIYGMPSLGSLLDRIAGINALKWIRVLYAYPNTIDEALIDTMLSHDNIVKYIDMPIQHIDPTMLERMNRHGTAEHIRYITDYIRRASPDFILRTTVMTGFPGETEEQFGCLAEFLVEHPFDRVGAFSYSQEDGTPAAEFADQINEDVAKRRLDELMTTQNKVSEKLNIRRIGRTYDVLIEKVADKRAYGRSYAEAPDVDGNISVKGVPKEVKPGCYVKVKITAAGAYDLKGEYIDESAE